LLAMKKIFAVFALALMTIAAHAQTGKNAAEARRIFDEMRATYSRLETFSHGHSILEVDGKKTIFGNQFAFRAPNLFLEVRHQPEGDQIGVSNGRTCYRYDPAYSKVPYLALPMPPAKLGRIGIVQYTGVGNDLALFLAG